MHKVKLLKSKSFTASALLLIWIIFSTLVFKILENWNWIEAFYFSVVTLTTIGFGDFVPTTDGMRLFVAFYILGGVSVVLASLTIIGNTLIQRYHSRLEYENEKLQKKVEVLSMIETSNAQQYQKRLKKENRHLREIIASIKSVITKNSHLSEEKKD